MLKSFVLSKFVVDTGRLMELHGLPERILTQKHHLEFAGGMVEVFRIIPEFRILR